MDWLRVQRALRHRVTPSADITVDVGSQVLLWREKHVANRIGEWTGQKLVTAVDRTKNRFYVTDEHSRSDPSPFVFAQVKPYYTPVDASSSLFCGFSPFIVSESVPSRPVG